MITLYELIVEWDYLWANYWFGARKISTISFSLMSWRVGAWQLGKKDRSHVAWVKWLHGWYDLIIVLWRYDLSCPCFFTNISHQSLTRWSFTCFPMLLGMGTHVLCKLLSKNHYSPLPWIIWLFMPWNVKIVPRKLWIARAYEGQDLLCEFKEEKGW